MHVREENLCEFVYSVSCVFVEGPLLQEEHALRELLCAISFVYLRQIYEFQKTSDCIMSSTRSKTIGAVWQVRGDVEVGFRGLGRGGAKPPPPT